MVDVYHQQQLPSLPDDDFEVIQGSLSPYDMSMLPQENNSITSSDNRETEDEAVRQNEVLGAQLAAAIERCASMRSSLSSHRILIERLTHQHQSRVSEVDQWHQVKAQLAQLLNRQEEWQQTAEDYMKLKNQYNLLANTRERLESEKADLLAKLNSCHQTATQQDDDGKVATAIDYQVLKDQHTLMVACQDSINQAVSEADFQQMKLNASRLENELQEVNSKLSEMTTANVMLEQRLQELSGKNLFLEEELNQMKQQIVELENKLVEETAKLSSAEHSHRNELEDLRQNSNVRELEDLRQDLYTCLKREQDLSDHYKESDQTINAIINDAEKSKQELQDELSAIKKERKSLFDSLEGTSKRLQAVTQREMDRAEEVKKLTARLTQAENAHRQEMHDTIQRHLAETNSTRQASQCLELQLRSVERELKSSAAEVEKLKSRVDQLTRENADSARTVNEVLTQTDSQKREIQAELNREKSLRADLEDQLQRKIAAHAETMVSVDTLRRHTTETQNARAALERQLRDLNTKCEDSVNFANLMRERLQSEIEKASRLDAELTNLRFEHNSIRTSYVTMETKVNECLSIEHTLESRALSAEDRVRSLELALDNYRRDFTKEKNEKEVLLAEKNSLSEQLEKVRNFLQPPSQ